MKTQILCIKHQWLLSSDVNHKDYTGPTDEEKRNECWDSQALTLLSHAQHGHRILRWEIPQAKINAEGFI